MIELEDLILGAGEQESPPPPPAGGIPRQYLPGWLRWPLRCAMLPFIWLDRGAHWVARKILRPPYITEGTCKRRGNCCYYILLAKPRGFLGTLVHWWNQEVNGFYPRSKELYEHEGMQVMIMGCRYLQQDGSCKHYHLRPSICRGWPAVERFGYPRILKGCGFHIKSRKQGHDPLRVIQDYEHVCQKATDTRKNPPPKNKF